MTDLLAQAASGDAVAQGALAAQFTCDAISGALPASDALAAAEVYARMAAAACDDVDLMGLASVLLIRAGVASHDGEDELATRLQAEAIVTISTVADGGNEWAAEMLNLAGEVCTQDGWAMARERVRRNRQASAPVG